MLISPQSQITKNIDNIPTAISLPTWEMWACAQIQGATSNQ